MEHSYSASVHLLGNGGENEYQDKKLKSPSRGLLKRLFPTGFKYEFVLLIKYSWPIIATMFLGIFIRVVPTTFTGHLGKLQLDATTMAISLANLVGTSIGIGLIAACDTLFSQSFGSTNKKQVGVYLQTALFVSTLCCFVFWAILMNTNNLLLALGQDPRIAKLTEEFLFIFMPGIYFLFLYRLVTRYMQVQGITLSPMIISLIVNVVSLGFQYLFVYVVDLGLRGSAVSLLLSYFLLALMPIVYIIARGLHRVTWAGWSRHALQDWGKFMKLGISSVMMICLEWWTFEIAMFLMGILGPVALGANSIMYNIWMCYASMSLGLGMAAAFRIGRYLGAMNVDGAITATRVYLVIACAVAVITAIITVALGHYLPLIFSTDPDVLRVSRIMIPILAIFSIFGHIKNVLSGIVRGTGKQVLGGIIAFVSYFIFSMPIGIPLMFLTSIRGSGFWWGLVIGYALGCFALGALVLKTNWQYEADNAQVVAKILSASTRKKSSVAPPTDKGTTETSGDYGTADNSTSAEKPSQDDTSGSDSQKTLIAEEQQSLPNKLVYTEAYWRKLFIKRALTAVVCLGIFAFGVVSRFIIFIPPVIYTNFNDTVIIAHNITPVWHG